MPGIWEKEKDPTPFNIKGKPLKDVDYTEMVQKAVDCA